jgi:hypothetical protein
VEKILTPFALGSATVYAAINGGYGFAVLYLMAAIAYCFFKEE